MLIRFLFLTYILCNVITIYGQKQEKRQIVHPVYGIATEEIWYTVEGIPELKLVYTTDANYTKGQVAIGTMEYYHVNGTLKAKGPFVKVAQPTFNGVTEERLMIGNWNMYYEDGTLQSSYVYKENRVNGSFTTYHKNGKKAIEGFLKNGIPTGIMSTYFMNGQLHSKVKYKNGRLMNVQAFFDNNGKALSHGTLKNGYGTFKMYNPDTAQLEEILTLEEGEEKQVEITYTQRNTITITEKKYKNKQGQIISIARLVAGKKEGKQEYYNAEGQLIETIVYSNGLKEGKHTKYNPNGTLYYEYSYVGGKRIGPFKNQLEGYRGELYALEEGTYGQDEKLHGTYIRYVQDKDEVISKDKNSASKKIIQKGAYKEGKKVGVWESFSLNGALLERKEYTENTNQKNFKKVYYADKITLKTLVEEDNAANIRIKKDYHDNGQLKMYRRYKNDKLEGLFTEYYKNGIIETEGEYWSDKRAGTWITYTKEGKIEEQMTYVGEGCPVETNVEFNYSRDGLLRSVITHSNLIEDPKEGGSYYYEFVQYQDFDDQGKIESLTSFRHPTSNTHVKVKEGMHQEYDLEESLVVKGFYKNDEKDGTWKSYHKNGELHQERYYQNGMPIGEWKTYNEKGKITHRKKY
ncbi:toxin-antitoxin system YwqK family antitoxin [Croceivirga sp. JEA036]|uniref:toxin-antitoxin system YwqK family antitoxin n=1 Tax=Croceivirga sp. JEA036 TaxID=2721162 RepID=UPI00143B70C5|nr:hypothetical protein [Croceivirga sp. JEA036]NJB37820.1 hypothetical protein [Croceivirga sp. JEA036]